MPEIRECFIHYKHACHVLVDKLGLGQNQDNNWALQAIFADATNAEAGITKGSNLRSCLTVRHGAGYIGQLDSSCTLKRGQTTHQTSIWPGTVDAVEEVNSLALSGLSYTPRALILKFKWLDPQGPDQGLDLQVCSVIY
jgi:hypothetical protein